MGNTLKRLSVTGVAAVAIFAATTVTANAATGGASCSTSGATGSLTFTNWSDNYVDISGWVKDTSADGHNVAIQLISSNGDGAPPTPWPWHHNYNGNGSTLSFTTHASTSGGQLRYIGAHVAVFEGDTIVSGHTCSDWA